jgi:hypothetical protein
MCGLRNKGQMLTSLLLIALIVLYYTFLGLLLQFLWNRGLTRAIPALRPVTFTGALCVFIAAKLLFGSSCIVEVICSCSELSAEAAAEETKSVEKLRSLHHLLKAPVDSLILTRKRLTNQHLSV